MHQIQHDWEDVELAYDETVSKYKDRITKCKSMSKDWLLANRTEQYDFIYIDGDHTPKAVINDGVLAWDLLKVGGIMAFDDYLWQHPNGDPFRPGPAIDLFQQMYTKRKPNTGKQLAGLVKEKQENNVYTGLSNRKG
jgi:hypothetical protein